jgi:hypothetical protein
MQKSKFGCWPAADRDLPANMIFKQLQPLNSHEEGRNVRV